MYVPMLARLSTATIMPCWNVKAKVVVPLRKFVMPDDVVGEAARSVTNSWGLSTLANRKFNLSDVSCSNKSTESSPSSSQQSLPPIKQSGFSSQHKFGEFAISSAQTEYSFVVCVVATVDLVPQL
eukprot:GHVS01082989.1.p2 GENE.GHVS01082989.1~~GHVS01082989.1.p2  ORF type:complete len:125 (-),score=20.15 GHVS01082989.1:83-457(-)